MNITIKYTNIEPSPAIEQYVRKKIGSLERLVRDIERNEPMRGDALHARVEVGKITRHHRKGRVFYAECFVHLPGGDIRKESTQYDLRVAIDDVKDSMERLLKRYKQKQEAKRKRGAREAKRKGKISTYARLREIDRGKRNLREGN